MKKLLQIIFCVVFISALFGCSTTSDFNREQTMNEYAGIALYAPNKINIKEQIITNTVNNAVTSTTIIKTDENGRVIYAQIKDLSGVQMESSTDYDNLKFNEKFPMLFIDIKNGAITLDSKGRIEKVQGKNDIITYHYNGNKLVLIESKGSLFDIKDEYHWQAHLINKAESIVKDKSGNTVFNIESNTNYDSKGRIVNQKDSVKILGVVNVEMLTTIEEYNEYGDWIKATINYSFPDQKDEQETVTREITYW